MVRMARFGLAMAPMLSLKVLTNFGLRWHHTVGFGLMNHEAVNSNVYWGFH